MVALTGVQEDLAKKRMLYTMLKQEGHAVQLSTVEDNQGQLVSVHLVHYLTCYRCLEKTRERERVSHKPDAS